MEELSCCQICCLTWKSRLRQPRLLDTRRLPTKGAAPASSALYTFLADGNKLVSYKIQLSRIPALEPSATYFKQTGVLACVQGQQHTFHG